MQAARPGESRDEVWDRFLREWGALQQSPFWWMWAGAGVDDMLSARIWSWPAAVAAVLIRPRNARAQGIGRSAPKGRHRDCAYRRGHRARGLRNQPGPIRRIWTSFGYDEINWTYTPAGKRNAPRHRRSFAEQPYFVRPHYVFN